MIFTCRGVDKAHERKVFRKALDYRKSFTFGFDSDLFVVHVFNTDKHIAIALTISKANQRMTQPHPVAIDEPAHVHHFSRLIRAHHLQESVLVEHAMAKFQIILVDFRELIIVHDVVQRNVTVKPAEDFLVQIVHGTRVNNIRSRFRIHVVNVNKVLGQKTEKFHLHVAHLAHFVLFHTFSLVHNASDGHTAEQHKISRKKYEHYNAKAKKDKADFMDCRHRHLFRRRNHNTPVIHCQRLVIETVRFFPVVFDAGFTRSASKDAIHKGREQALFIIHLVLVIMDALQRIMLGVRNKASIVAIDDVHVHFTVIALVLTQVLMDQAQTEIPVGHSNRMTMTFNRHKMVQELFFLLIAFKAHRHMRIRRCLLFKGQLHFRGTRYHAIWQNHRIARQENADFLVAQKRLHFTQFRLQAIHRIIATVPQGIRHKLERSTVMQVIHYKFVRRHLGIFTKSIEATVFNDFQNLLADKQKNKSRHHKKNYSKNKVILMHHLVIMGTINIFQHSVITS